MDLTRDSLMARLSEYTGIEKDLRDYYKQNHTFPSAEYFYELAIKHKGIHQDLNWTDDMPEEEIIADDGKDSSLLLEERMIQALSDISIRKHPRYTPEFRHSHTFFEIAYVLTGKCIQTLWYDKSVQRLELVAGDFLILPPSTEHCILVDDDSIILDILIRKSTFDTAFLHNMPENSILHSFFSQILYARKMANYILYHTQTHPGIEETIITLTLAYCTKSLYFSKIVNLRLSLLFLYLLQDCGGVIEFSKHYSRDIDYIPDVIHYMEKHYAHTTVRDIAAHFNFDANYLSKFFKKHTQSTLQASLQQIKLRKCAELLIQTRLPLQEIIAMVGYQELSSFIRSFKKYFHMTPYQYRKTFQP